jgi:hypothetical protein
MLITQCNKIQQNDFNEYYKFNRDKNPSLETLGEIAYIISDPEKMINITLLKVVNNPTNDNFKELCRLIVPSIGNKFDIADLYFALACLVRGYCDKFISYYYPRINLREFKINVEIETEIQSSGIYKIRNSILYIYTRM